MHRRGSSVWHTYVALNLCEAEKLALARFVGPTFRAHSAARTDLAQRAKAGYRPRRTRATNLALSPTHPLGEFHLPKSDMDPGRPGV